MKNKQNTQNKQSNLKNSGCKDCGGKCKEKNNAKNQNKD